jgi:hypothetical protein
MTNQEKQERLEKYEACKTAVGGLCCGCGCDQEMTLTDVYEDAWYIDLILNPDCTEPSGFNRVSDIRCPESW